MEASAVQEPARRTERPNMSHSFYNWESIHSRITPPRYPLAGKAVTGLEELV